MKISNVSTYLKATVKVEVEGFFIERFINLCKINNLEIWDIVYINSGKISFSTTPQQYKKLKPYLKKTKCKSNITRKKGIYFEFFRYRKRRNLLFLCIFLIILWATLSTFIWNIQIKGNERVSDKEILNILKKSNIYVGKNKLFVSKGDAVDYIRAEVYDIAWVGLEFKGTTLDVSIVEKIVDDGSRDMSINGDIIATKSAVITKIIAENGTAMYKTGSYIQEGSIAIRGAITSEYIGERRVHASGILKGIVEYNFEKDYKYTETLKKYTKKKRFGIGIGINNKKFVLKYLPKKNKYDININEKKFIIFGIEISFIFNRYYEYSEYEQSYNYEELKNKGKDDSKEYIQKILTDDAKIFTRKENILNSRDRYQISCFL